MLYTDLVPGKIRNRLQVNNTLQYITIQLTGTLVKLTFTTQGKIRDKC
jgi:hypothetical protein